MMMLPPADVEDKHAHAFIAHETGHQWWGNIVAWRSYRDQWLSEGFAEYSGILYAGKRDRERDKAAADLIREGREAAAQSSAYVARRRHRPLERHRAARAWTAAQYQQDARRVSGADLPEGRARPADAAFPDERSRHDERCGIRHDDDGLREQVPQRRRHHGAVRRGRRPALRQHAHRPQVPAARSELVLQPVGVQHRAAHATRWSTSSSPTPTDR